MNHEYLPPRILTTMILTFGVYFEDSIISWFLTLDNYSQMSSTFTFRG